MATSSMTWGFRQPRLNKRQRRFVPTIGIEVIWDRFRKVDHNAERGAIGGRSRHDRSHCSHLGRNDAGVDTQAREARTNQLSKPAREVPDASRWNQ